MKTSAVLLALLSAFLALPVQAATITSNCTATVQGIGACAVADNGKAGVLIAYWASSVDDAPTDSEVASNAADLRDAICANFGVPSASCTAASADGALRRYLEGLVKSYRGSKKVVAIPTVPTPAIDAQVNP